MLCPRCQQGSVVEARVRKTGVVLHLCEECEATWFSPEEVDKASFVDFETYMKGEGLHPLWNELTLAENRPK
ncbi:zf-TFIIB domain-containing protein [Roseateles sp. P5_E4]